MAALSAVLFAGRCDDADDDDDDDADDDDGARFNLRVRVQTYRCCGENQKSYRTRLDMCGQFSNLSGISAKPQNLRIEFFYIVIGYDAFRPLKCTNAARPLCEEVHLPNQRDRSGILGKNTVKRLGFRVILSSTLCDLRHFERYEREAEHGVAAGAPFPKALLNTQQYGAKYGISQ